MLTISKIRSANYHKNDGKKVKESTKEYHKEDSVNSYFLGAGSMNPKLNLITAMYESKTDIPEDGLLRLSKGYHPLTNELVFKVEEKPKKEYKEKEINTIFNYLEKNWDGEKINLKVAMDKSKRQFKIGVDVSKEKTKYKLTDKDKKKIRETYFKKEEINLGTDACLSAPKDFTLLAIFDKSNSKIYEDIYKKAVIETSKEIDKLLFTSKRLNAKKMNVVYEHFSRLWDGDYKTIAETIPRAYDNFFNNVPLEDKPKQKLNTSIKDKIRDSKQGKEIIELAGIMLAYDHNTSRPVDGERPDPQWHTHILIMKQGIEIGSDPENPKWVGVDTHDLAANQKAIGAFFRKELSNGLREKLGFTIEESKEFFEDEETNKGEYVNSFKVKGIEEKHREIFSRRANKINSLAGQNASYKLKKLMSLSTREQKQEWDSRELMDVWLADAQKVGLTQNFIESIKVDIDQVNPTKFIERKHIKPEHYYLGQVTDNNCNIKISHLKAKLYEQEQYSGIKGNRLFNAMLKRNDVYYDNKTRQYKSNFSMKDLQTSNKVIDKFFFNKLPKLDSIITQINSNILKIKEDRKENNLTVGEIFAVNMLKHEQTNNVKLADHSSLDSMRGELGLLQNMQANPNISDEEKGKILKQIAELGFKIKAEEERLKNENNKLESK